MSSASRDQTYVPLPPRFPSGTSLPSPNAFLIAAVVLKPQYRAAWAVVSGPSRKQLGSAAVDKEAPETPIARSSTCKASRMNRRRKSSRVTFNSQVTNVFSYCSANPSDRHAHPAVGVRRARARSGIPEKREMPVPTQMAPEGFPL